MEIEFDEIVRAWRIEIGGRLPESRTERVECFINLLGNLKDYGYDKETISNSKNFRLIISYCVNPNHVNKKKLHNWVAITSDHLRDAIAIFFGAVKIKMDYVTDEMRAKNEAIAQKAQEQAKLSKERKENVEEASNETVAEPDTFIITDEMLQGMSAPDYIEDPDFYKNLGMSDD